MTRPADGLVWGEGKEDVNISNAATWMCNSGNMGLERRSWKRMAVKALGMNEFGLTQRRQVYRATNKARPINCL